MCNLFMSQDPATYQPETRAHRLHGHSTSFLRVTCMHYLRNEELHAQQLAGRPVPAVMSVAAE